MTALNPQYGFANRDDSQFYGMGKRLQGFDDALDELKDPTSKTEALIWVIDPNNLKNSKLTAIMNDPGLDIMDFNDTTLTSELTPELLSRDPLEILEQMAPASAVDSTAVTAAPARPFGSDFESVQHVHGCDTSGASSSHEPNKPRCSCLSLEKRKTF